MNVSFRAILLAGALLATACSGSGRSRKSQDRDTARTLVLWAWDRHEDLRFLDQGEAEVAGLLATIRLKRGQASIRYRSLPLFVPDGIPLRAVIRIESDGSGLPPAGGIAHWFEAVAFRSRPDGLQLDFDARQSERTWYLDVLREARTWFKDISMTALTSWCLEDRPWFADRVPSEVQEIVPMMFRMGPQRVAVLERLQSRRDFAPVCQGSLGVALDEPLPWHPPARRIYVFSATRWTRQSFEQACARLR